MIKITESCTGCFACASICPLQSISLQVNEFGELYPTIDQTKCVDCGMCTKVCPTNSTVRGVKPEAVYAAYSKNLEIYKQSTSGGISMEIAKVILSNGGIVYGTGMDGVSANIIRVDSEKDLCLIQGSKYVQSHMNDAMQHIKKDLEAGKKVVFFGVPCQVAGVRNFFKKSVEGLYLIDILCHGAPSQDCLLQGISLETEKQVVNVKFRENTKYCLSLTTSSGSIIKVPYRRSYWFNGFVEGYIMREVCYSCGYAKTERMGDISLGDFWGLNREKTALKHPYGINLVLVNTPKGKSLWNILEENVFFEEHELTEAIPYNHSLEHPIDKPNEYNIFRKMYSEAGGAYAIRNAFRKKTRYIRVRRWFAKHKILSLVVMKLPKISNKLKDYPD